MENFLYHGSHLFQLFQYTGEETITLIEKYKNLSKSQNKIRFHSGVNILVLVDQMRTYNI